jgi:hypothetical protein
MGLSSSKCSMSGLSAKLTCSEFGDLRREQQSTGDSLNHILTMKYLVVCGAESGWRYGRPGEGSSNDREMVPLLVANEEGKAQGVSIEKGLRVQDVIGRMIVIREFGIDSAVDSHVLSCGNIRKRGPALGVIGCQCVRNRIC